MTYKSDPRGTRPVRLVAVHTAEGSRTAASLGSYFYSPSVQASSHVGIDSGATLQFVGYDRSAWTLRSGNPISDNAELCGFAHWTREQWLSTATADGCVNPRAILDRTAAWIRSRCLARGIPIRKLTPAQVAAGQSGVVAHWDWTLGMHDGTHTDPGSGFPWDYVIAKASASAPATETDWIDMATKAEVQEAFLGALETFFYRRNATGRNPLDDWAQQTGSQLDLQQKAESANEKQDDTNAKLDETNAKLDELIDVVKANGPTA
jgi:N-acetyl-anhydromuramyl-L-alanine amidase AmpD